MMALNAEVQRMAQAEIDSVVGSDRLPDFIDRERLPYITAVMKETLRFHSPSPTGESLSATSHSAPEIDLQPNRYTP